MQYLVGFALCVIVAFIYSSTRKDTPREIVHDGLVVLAWMLGAIAALTVFAIVGINYV